jgi:uncharacterized membrane protein
VLAQAWVIRRTGAARDLIAIGLLAFALGALCAAVYGPSRQWQLRTSSVIVFAVLADAFGYFLLFATLVSLLLISPRGLWDRRAALAASLSRLGPNNREPAGA